MTEFISVTIRSCTPVANFTLQSFPPVTGICFTYIY